MALGFHEPFSLRNEHQVQLQDRFLHGETFSIPPEQHRPHEDIPSLEEELSRLEGMDELPSMDSFMYILQRCRKTRCPSCARRALLHSCSCGLEAHDGLGNYVVPMLVECRSVIEGEQFFRRLTDRNPHSWASLLNGYVECGEPQQALDMYMHMQEDMVCRNRSAYMALLKACARLSSLESGWGIHSRIVIDGFETDLFVENALIDMYAKCGSFVDATDVLDTMPVQDVFSWTALIAGYSEHGFGEEAFACLQNMKKEGASPNEVTFICSLKSCSRIGALDKGREIYADIMVEGYESDFYVGHALIDMYAKCDSPVEAWVVFNELSYSDALLWNAMILGHVENGRAADAMALFHMMKREGVSPTASTYACILRACGSKGVLGTLQEIHTELAEKGFEEDKSVADTLIETYVQCGSLTDACELVWRLPRRSPSRWTTLIVECAEKGHAVEALKLFKQMQVDGASPDPVVLVSCLKACSNIGDVRMGRKIHMQVIKLGYEKINPYIGSSLVDFYAKCVSLVEARAVLEKLPVRGVFAWTALMAGYAQQGFCNEALACLEQMQSEAILPDALTLACGLNACSDLEYISMGHDIYIEVIKLGLEESVFLGNALIDVFVKCGSLVDARYVFDKLPVRDVVSWTSLVAGYTEHGFGGEAINCFQQMQLEGVPPDVVTFVCCLKACGIAGAIIKGREIHVCIVKDGLEEDYVVGSALMDMYAKCGSPEEAHDIFDELSLRDVVSWTALTAGYFESGHSEEAFNCFQQMQLEGVPPNVVSWNSTILGFAEKGEIDKVLELYGQMQEQSMPPNNITFTSVAAAFVNTAGRNFGRRLHTQITGINRLDTTDLVVGTALVDMYGKCSSMLDAQQAFEAMITKTTLTWNALITGYARQGENKLVFDLLEKMKEEGARPDDFTFLTVLTVCSHGGLVETGQKYFESMDKLYGVSPTLKHYVCMVDLLGRSGQLEKAVATVEGMCFPTDVILWRSILGACRKWGNVRIGRKAFDNVVRLDKTDGAAYVAMSNIYADAEMFEEAREIEAMRASIQWEEQKELAMDGLGSQLEMGLCSAYTIP